MRVSAPWPGSVSVPWCVLVIWAIGACADVEERPGVVYDARRSDAIMDVYLPGGRKTGRPAVMLVHGGGWRGGSRHHFGRTAERLAETGWVAATIDYRLVPAGRYPIDVTDCFCALSHLRAHAGDFGIDPGRVAVMGYSAGGHLVSLLGVAADVPEHHDCPDGTTPPADAVIAGAGPQDLRDFDVSAVRDYLGGSPTEIPAAWDAASPVSYVRDGLPPFLFVHATNDLFVPVEHSERMRDALVAAGNDAQLLTLTGGGHLFNEGVDVGHEYIAVSTDTPEAWAAQIDFLEQTVGGPD